MLGFTFQLDMSDRMTIFHHGHAIKLTRRLRDEPEDEQQRLMAAATSNYGRGNEKR